MSARGFTLIELMVCVAIVAILASAALPLSDLTAKRVKEQQLHRALREIRDALDAYKQAVEDGRIERKMGESGYPRRLEDLVAGIEDRRSVGKQRLYFLRRILRDLSRSDQHAVTLELLPLGQWRQDGTSGSLLAARCSSSCR